MYLPLLEWLTLPEIRSLNDVIQVAGWPKVFECNSFISFSHKFQVFKMKIIYIKNAKKIFFQNYYLSINECI